MSAAAAIPHRLPGQAVAIPRLLIRNQALLVPAEFRFATVLFDRMDREERFVPIADKDWTRQTGLDPRSKELAIKGLVAKKFLVVEGKGEKARFCSDLRGFQRWTAEADRNYRPRTAGRAVTVKKAVMHTECASGGCAMLRQQAAGQGNLFMLAGGCTPATPTESTQVIEFAKPVSQTVETVSAPTPVENPEDNRRPRHLKRKLRAQAGAETKPVVSTPVTEFAKPVSQNSAPISAAAPVDNPVSDIAAAQLAWPLALACLRRIIPGIDALFLLRLLEAVRARFSGVTDPELTQAVEQAWRGRSGYQKGAGLFLDTVPQALAALRARGEARAGPNNHFGSGTPMKPVSSEDSEKWTKALQELKEREKQKL